MNPLQINITKNRFDILIGVGGIGSGSFFLLNENHTLGREESRSGTFLDQNDYCKLHIISHYMKAFLGEAMDVIPVGKVGDDDVGEKLMREMQAAGLSTEYLEFEKGSSTLFSFCFLYPDGSGGNMTTSNSACSKTSPEDVWKTEYLFKQFQRKGIALAVPEVPLEIRFELLELATNYQFYRAASFTTEEVPAVLQSDVLEKVDYLAVNLDEAAAIVGRDPKTSSSGEIVDLSVGLLKKKYPALHLSITDGRNGSWSWDTVSIEHTSSVDPGDVVNSAGAGDAYMAGVLMGISTGLEFHEAQKTGALLGSYSVTSQHTIHENANGEALMEFAKANGIELVITK